MWTLPERVIAIAEAFSAVPHAFGGALSLAYHAEPRATRDIDCNVFVGTNEFARVLDPLSRLGADTSGADLDAAEIMRWVGRICGDTDQRYQRIAALMFK